MSSQKTNVVIFGLTGFDTADIVREMRESDTFNVVTWFGICEDSTINTLDFYEFKTDYNYQTNVPEALYFHLQKELFYFIDNQVRRAKIKNYWNTVNLRTSSIYEDLDNYHRYIYYFWNLLTQNQVDLVIIDGIPNCGADWVLAKIAEYLNIKLLILYPVPFSNKFVYFTEFVRNGVDFDIYYTDARPVRETLQPFKIEKRAKLFYMNATPLPPDTRQDQQFVTKEDIQWALYTWKWDLFSYFSRFSFIEKTFKLKKRLSGMPHPNSGYTANYNPTSYPFKKLWCDLRWDFVQHLKSRDFEALANKARFMVKYLDYKDFRRWINATPNDIDFSRPYVYFPLHYQPEMTTQCQANEIYLNQALVIEKLANLIPDDWYIYVKENPIQNEICRAESFYERLKAIPKVRMASVNVNTFELIENSQFVSVISGTAGIEALKNDKKTLLFGNNYYQCFPGVFRYHENFQLSDLLNYELKLEDVEQAFSLLLARMENGVANSDHSAMVENFDSKENAKLMLRFFERFMKEETPLLKEEQALSPA